MTNDIEVATKLSGHHKQEKMPWYQHEEVGYNYRMSNVIAGVVRGQYPYLEEHIAQKRQSMSVIVTGLRTYLCR